MRALWGGVDHECHCPRRVAETMFAGLLPAAGSRIPIVVGARVILVVSVSTVGEARQASAPLPHGPVPRPSPRLRVVPRGYHEVGAIGAALRAAKPQLGQRHVAATGLHERLEVGVGLMAAGIAEHQHADVAGAQCGARCGQDIIARPLGIIIRRAVAQRPRLGAARSIGLAVAPSAPGQFFARWRVCGPSRASLVAQSDQ